MVSSMIPETTMKKKDKKKDKKIEELQDSVKVTATPKKKKMEIKVIQIKIKK